MRFYSGRLRTVEINNTFHHMPVESLLLSWAEQTPENFIFAFKAPQRITHMKRLKNVDEEVEYLFRTLAAIGKRLGPVLFQLPRSFKADYDALEKFLRLLPAGAACAFEFRSPSWSDKKVLQLLAERGCCLCISDSDEQPANDIVSTAQWGYLRLRRSDYTEAELSVWMEKILKQNWKKTFVFFKHGEDNAAGPETALLFQKLAAAV